LIQQEQAMALEVPLRWGNSHAQQSLVQTGRRGGIPMLEEKLKEAIIGELQRQAADKPQSLRVESSDGLVVNGKVDLDDLVMVIAGSVAGGP
jgi:hypothetical protein